MLPTIALLFPVDWSVCPLLRSEFLDNETESIGNNCFKIYKRLNLFSFSSLLLLLMLMPEIHRTY